MEPGGGEQAAAERRQQYLLAAERVAVTAEDQAQRKRQYVHAAAAAAAEAFESEHFDEYDADDFEFGDEGDGLIIPELPKNLSDVRLGASGAASPVAGEQAERLERDLYEKYSCSSTTREPPRSVFLCCVCKPTVY